MDDHIGVRSRSNLFRVETERVPTTQEQMVRADSVLRSLTPIINSMRLFGLYFTREAQINYEMATDQSQQQVRRCHLWSLSRIHATFILIVMWLNTARYAFIFDGQETLGLIKWVKV